MTTHGLVLIPYDLAPTPYGPVPIPYGPELIRAAGRST